jgi:L-Ala-D/L-Glu epimerase
MGFKIKSLLLREMKIPFRFSFAHARKTRKENNIFIVEAHGENGLIGYGEIITREYLTGETKESVEEDFKNRLWPLVKEIEFNELNEPCKELNDIYQESDTLRRTASYAGLDLAIYDLWGKTFKKCGATLLQPSPERSKATLPIGSSAPLSATALLGKAMGFTDFKLKVGQENDFERLTLLRKILGPSINIRLDANEAWTPVAACEKLKSFAHLGCSSIEQPVAGSDFEGLRYVKENSELAIMADESICTLSDAQELIASNAADIWNLRLAKNGGITGIKTIIDIAQKNSIETHLGVLVGETTLLGNASICCLGLDNFRHVEIGFSQLLLKKNPFKGSVLPLKGYVKNSIKGFGFGASPTPHLTKLTTKETIFS